MVEISPSKVRIRALREYEALRSTIDELDNVAARLLTQGEAAGDEALLVTAKLLQELSDYVDLEQLFVLPTIRRVDIWGSIRADTLAQDHDQQREGLRAIGRAHHQPIDPYSLAADLQVIVQSLRGGLAREERDVFGVNALKDDVVDTEPD